MKPKTLWVIKTRHGLVRDPHYHSPLGTLFFKTRKHAQLWLADNTYWLNLKAQPVKVNVRVTETL
jgi:hypothetical protein